jgi:hypothetical protein
LHQQLFAKRRKKSACDFGRKAQILEIPEKNKNVPDATEIAATIHILAACAFCFSWII